MNKHIALIPIAALALLTVVGCGTGPDNHPGTSNANTASTTNTNTASTNTASTANTNTTGTHTTSTAKTKTAGTHTASTSATSTSNVKTVSTSTGNTDAHAVSNSSVFANEIALIKQKGYDVTGAKPNATVQTSSGATLTAWIGVAAHSDGHNQYVFFFLNGKYLGTDTAKPSLEITNVKSAGTGAIAATYPVYQKNDSFAHPTGTPVTITYTWSGSKLIPNKAYPKQFS